MAQVKPAIILAGFLLVSGPRARGGPGDGEAFWLSGGASESTQLTSNCFGGLEEMTVCPKCKADNEVGLTRCASCNAIMPVKMGSKSAVRYERVRRQPDLVGTKCPKCGADNAYTRIRCQSCDAPLSAKQERSGLGKVWSSLTSLLKFSS
jgi:predicted amidophosphoribosyltransferase